jgi:Chromosome segregation ATPases
MQIVNAKKSTLTFIMQNGTVVSIPPMDVSGVFLATEEIVRTMIISNNPDEIGIVIGNTFEYDIAKRNSGCLPYLYNTVEEAKSKLFEGKDISMTAPPKSAKEVDGLRLEIGKKEETIKDLKRKVKGLEEALQSAGDTQETAAPGIESDTILELNSKVEELTRDLKIKTKDLDSHKVTISKLDESVTKLNQKLDSKETEILKLKQKIEAGEVIVEKSKLIEKELREAGDAVSTHNTKLEKTLKKLMADFNITFVDGKYIQGA